MKTLLLIYAISCCILLLYWIYDIIKQRLAGVYCLVGFVFDPWYKYLIRFILAPLYVYRMPFEFWESIRKKKRDAKYRKEQLLSAERYKQQNKLSCDRYDTARICSMEALNDWKEQARTIESLFDKHLFNEMKSCFPHLKFPKDMTIRLVQLPTREWGTEQTMYFMDETGTKYKDVFSFVEVEESLEGAWDAFLLHNLLCRHIDKYEFCYERIDFLFDSADMCKQVSLINLPNIPNIEEAERIKNEYKEFYKDKIEPPEVRVNGNSYFFKCWYIALDHSIFCMITEITIKNNKCVEFRHVQP